MCGETQKKRLIPPFSIIEGLDPPDFRVFRRKINFESSAIFICILRSLCGALTLENIGRCGNLCVVCRQCNMHFPHVSWSAFCTKGVANYNQLHPITTNYPPITLKKHHQLHTNYTHRRMLHENQNHFSYASFTCFLRVSHPFASLLQYAIVHMPSPYTLLVCHGT